MLCEDQGGVMGEGRTEAQMREDVCILMTDSRGCMAETVTIL